MSLQAIQQGRCIPFCTLLAFPPFIAFLALVSAFMWSLNG